MISAMERGSRFWRLRLAERLDLAPSARWADIELEIIAVRGRAAVAERDRGEMLAFVQQCEAYWWERGRTGGPSPLHMPDDDE